MHRTGHSIDNDLQGGGADLDDFEVKDTRILTPGTGFTVGPGLYFPGQFGVRTEVSRVPVARRARGHDARAGRRRSAAEVAPSHWRTAALCSSPRGGSAAVSRDVLMNSSKSLLT